MISDFGTDPLDGFPQTDYSQYQSIAYSSSIDSFELHLRKRWIAPNCRVQGSWLAGVRYLYLLEDFRYLTVGADDPATGFPVGDMTYDVRTKNSVTGFQLGGDLWTSIVPGISLGGELKGGIYGNYAQQGTHIVATDTDPVFVRDASVGDTGSDAAFVGQGNIMLVYRTSPNWAIRTGYTFLYVDGVALAPENFTPDPPLFDPDPASGDRQQERQCVLSRFHAGPGMDVVDGALHAKDLTLLDRDQHGQQPDSRKRGPAPTNASLLPGSLAANREASTDRHITCKSRAAHSHGAGSPPAFFIQPPPEHSLGSATLG